jgi:aminopeptidase N
MLRILLIACLLFLHAFAYTQSSIDVQHYRFALQLSDASDTLKGTARITIQFSEPAQNFYLSLASVKEGKGMTVRGVSSGDTTFSFTHARDTLFISLPQDVPAKTINTIAVTYAGIPADGLIISKNKWGERTFFSDNWPDRAHQWIPCNDRPDDKATVDFIVTAPAHYKVISNGVMIAETTNGVAQKTTHWKESVPIPTKVMVIGAARFAVKQFSDSSITPVSAWVYRQDSTKGVYDYELAASIVKFFSGYIGPYPFEKLANVQSKTIFGGMENAGAIFYAENTVTGTRKSEALLAHEIAHQWFGNSATETGFAHLWLSEGFASYMTHLYLEQKYGRDTLVKRLEEDRREIIRFARQWPKPVVDSASALMELLNANSYQKGSWVLHMLRNEVGDSLFQNSIRTYYNRYRLGNAGTWDFEKVVENVTGKNHDAFVSQWLFTPGHPKLDVRWRWKSGRLTIQITQLQKTPLSFPLTIGISGAANNTTRHRLNITQQTQTIVLPVAEKPVRIILDPDTALLFEGKSSEVR